MFQEKDGIELGFVEGVGYKQFPHDLNKSAGIFHSFVLLQVNMKLQAGRDHVLYVFVFPRTCGRTKHRYSIIYAY